MVRQNEEWGHPIGKKKIAFLSLFVQPFPSLPLHPRLPYHRSFTEYGRAWAGIKFRPLVLVLQVLTKRSRETNKLKIIIKEHQSPSSRVHVHCVSHTCFPLPFLLPLLPREGLMSRGQRRPLDALIYERPSCASSGKNHSLHFQDHCCQHNLKEREEEERREREEGQERERRERRERREGKVWECTCMYMYILSVRMYMYCIVISHLPNSDVSGPIWGKNWQVRIFLSGLSGSGSWCNDINGRG